MKRWIATVAAAVTCVMALVARAGTPPKYDVKVDAQRVDGNIEVHTQIDTTDAAGAKTTLSAPTVTIREGASGTVNIGDANPKGASGIQIEVTSLKGKDQVLVALTVLEKGAPSFVKQYPAAVAPAKPGH